MFACWRCSSAGEAGLGVTPAPRRSNAPRPPPWAESDGARPADRERDRFGHEPVHRDRGRLGPLAAAEPGAISDEVAEREDVRVLALQLGGEGGLGDHPDARL